LFGRSSDVGFVLAVCVRVAAAEWKAEEGDVVQDAQQEQVGRGQIRLYRLAAAGQLVEAAPASPTVTVGVGIADTSGVVPLVSFGDGCRQVVEPGIAGLEIEPGVAPRA
jgi:hypothetical protein